MGLRFQPRTLLTLSLIAMFAYVVIAASDMPIQAKLYPWTIGLIALTLLTYQLVREILPSAEENSRETGVDFDFTKEEASPEGRRRALELFAWLYGFAALLWLIGYYLAIPLMVFLYLLRHRETRTIMIALPLGAGTATWGVFGYFLHLPFPPGVLLEMAGLS